MAKMFEKSDLEKKSDGAEIFFKKLYFWRVEVKCGRLACLGGL
jgi:hypothetical protein